MKKLSRKEYVNYKNIFKASLNLSFLLPFLQEYSREKQKQPEEEQNKNFEEQ